jgi:hypothetical protein
MIYQVSFFIESEQDEDAVYEGIEEQVPFKFEGLEITLID